GAHDAKPPTTRDCGNSHVTTPTFATDLLPTSPKPANHIPTTAVCAQCHTTTGNFAVYSVTGTHQGVTGCLSCHGPTVGPFVNVTLVSTPANHMPIGKLDGNGTGCHTTTPTFATDQTGNAKPANHIPTSAPCAQCHTTAGNNALYSVTGTHQGVTGCLTCHGSTVATTFANIRLVTNPSNHIPIGSLDCN